jgi:hypothetical protein
MMRAVPWLAVTAVLAALLAHAAHAARRWRVLVAEHGPLTEAPTPHAQQQRQETQT